MPRHSLPRRLAFAATVIVSSASLGACAHPRTVYDQSNNDRHRWDKREEAAYRRWEGERNARHVDYARRSGDDQRAYWSWRHEHPDRDR